jgi:hypothetical protein
MRTIMGYYTANNGNSLPTFWDNLSEQLLRVTYRPHLQWLAAEGGADRLPLKAVPIGCPETSVRIFHGSLHNNPEVRSSYMLRGGSPKSTNQLVCSHGMFFVFFNLRSYKMSFKRPAF